MKLMQDQIHESKVIVEDSGDGSKSYYIEGVFMQPGIKNRNSRMYPRAVLENQVQSYNSTYVKRGRALGELGHPTTPTINLERVSHNIVNLEYVGDTDVVGRAKLLDTPYGQIAKSFVREEIELGVSTRGLGSLKMSEGVSVVQNDFFLAAVDIVADPSAPGAFVNGIMENKEWILKDGILTEQEVDKVQKRVDKAASRGRTDEEILKIFNEIMSKI